MAMQLVLGKVCTLTFGSGDCPTIKEKHIHTNIMYCIMMLT